MDGRAGLAALKGTGAGRPCFVMGNGPSLNDTPLEALAGKDVFACNGAYLLFERVAWWPRYYACVDTLGLTHRVADIMAMLEDSPDTPCLLPRPAHGARWVRALAGHPRVHPAGSRPLLLP